MSIAENKHPESGAIFAPGEACERSSDQTGLRASAGGWSDAQQSMAQKEPAFIVGRGVKFERIRRITGYLVGTLDRWNNAKAAEERDRVKHVDIGKA